MNDLYEKVARVLAEYDAALAERGPRGGKPTVSEVAGAGRTLAHALRDILADEAWPSRDAMGRSAP